MTKLLLLLHVVFFALSGGAAAETIEKTVVRLGVMESAEPGFFANTVQPIAAALTRAIPHAELAIISLSPITLTQDILREQPDFFLVPSSTFTEIFDEMGAQPIAVRKSAFAENPASSVGAAFVVRNDRRDLADTASLRGRRAAATLPTSLDGWLAARLELRRLGYQDDRFFESVRFLTYSFPDVLSGVLSGAYDVGIVPACRLEQAQSSGLLEPGVLRVIEREGGEDDDAALACRHSTALYPDVVVGALPWTSPEFARSMTVALLTAPADPSPTGYSWQITADFHAVRSLYEALHLGPWAYLDSWTPSALWRRFGWYAAALLAAALLLIFNERRLRSLVRRRTAELERSMAREKALETAERNAREALAEAERTGAVSELCAMIAHELKQPINAAVNYMAILKVKLVEAAASGASGWPDPFVVQSLSGADVQVRRIAAIIDKVRGYARKEAREPTVVDLSDCAKRAAAHLDRTPGPAVRCRLTPKACVLGDALELELLVLNLLKNAREAADGAPDGLAEVAVTMPPDAGAVVLTVSDNGPPMSDEKFARLVTLSKSIRSDKADGLGLGLRIVRNIVDEHGASLTIERMARGLNIIVRFERCQAPLPDESGAPSRTTPSAEQERPS